MKRLCRHPAVTVLTWLFLSNIVVRAESTIFGVRESGARGDGHVLDTAAIQEAFDAGAKNGGTVEFPAGTYLSGPLFLRGNNVTVKLDAGAVLQGTPDFSAYRRRLSDRDVVGLINAVNMTNVTLCGPGVIDGGGEPWWPAVKAAKKTGALEPRRRPKMVNFHHCQNLIVRDITLRNSPSFHLVPVDCDNVLIDNVTIQAPGDSPNTDAIDPGPCAHVRIVNCLLDVGDDNVAVKAGHAVAGRVFCCEDIVVSNCACLHGHGISIGSETSGGVSNFSVLHCTFDGTLSGIRIKTTREKGGPVENIFYNDLSMKNVRRPIDISCYYPRLPKTDEARPVTALTPFYHDIHIENVRGNCPEGASLIVGLPESPVRDITLSNVDLSEATGLLIRNAEGVRLSEVKFNVQNGDSIVTENAKIKAHD